MEQPGTVNAIRLRSQKGAYVVANDDKGTVGESDGGSSPNAKWVVERMEGKPNVIRLRSCFGLYLTATDGKVDWEPIPDGDGVKLKSWGDKLLQASGEAKRQNWAVDVMRWVGELLQSCCEPNSMNWVFWDVEDEDDLSSSSFEDTDNMLAPLLQFNPTDTRALYRSAEVSYDSGQRNSQVRLDAEQPRVSQVSYDSGQRNSQVRSVEKSSPYYRSYDSGQRNSPPRR